MRKDFKPTFKPIVQINEKPDDENMCDTYVPRGNREAVKLHEDIFEKFN